MKSSELSLQDARAIFDHEDNYPLMITVAGETKAMTADEVAALRRARVPFSLDEAQVSRILIRYGTC